MGCCNSKDEPKKPQGADKKSPANANKASTKATTPKDAQSSAAQKAEKEEQAKRLEAEAAAAAAAADEEEAAAAAEAEAEREAAEKSAAAAEEAAPLPEAFTSPYLHDRCLVDSTEEERTACFEDGLVFRIIKGDTWYFYNDTLEYEGHVDYRFGPGSHIVPGEKTTVETTEDGWVCANMTIYPLETIEFISGTHCGFSSGVTVTALSDDYREVLCEDANRAAAEQLEAVKALAGDDESDEEEVLKLCVSNGVPYVDVHFPPVTESLSRSDIDSHRIPTLAMKRPSDYLTSEERQHCDAVVSPVLPEAVAHGLLGDSWLLCAASVLAEEPRLIRDIFTPDNRDEKDVGAYRVQLSQGGWWRSVILDNFLPTICDTPVFGRSHHNRGELWVSLFQKAYAKINGSYAAITGGDVLLAIQDFTGYPTQRFDKEWAEAAEDDSKAGAFFQKLIGPANGTNVLIFSTPGHGSTSYLGATKKQDPEAFEAKYKAAGLDSGFSYVVKRVMKLARTYLFEIHNPAIATGKPTWSGAWGAGSPEWEREPEAASQCNPEESARRDCFWISWQDAKQLFDGAGIVFVRRDSVDYRVKGAFLEGFSNVVLQVSVTEPVCASVVLSQRDRRGRVKEDPLSLWAPIMVSVATKTEDSTFRVDKSSGTDVMSPSTDEFNFVVARDAAMEYTFEPGHTYLVVPRAHNKGFSDDCEQREYVVGLITTRAEAASLNVEVRQLDRDNAAFRNMVSFDAGELISVEAEIQEHRFGAPVVSTVGRRVCGEDAAAAPPASEEPAAAAAAAADEPAASAAESPKDRSVEKASAGEAQEAAAAESAEAANAAPAMDDEELSTPPNSEKTSESAEVQHAEPREDTLAAEEDANKEEGEKDAAPQPPAHEEVPPPEAEAAPEAVQPSAEEEKTGEEEEKPAASEAQAAAGPEPREAPSAETAEKDRFKEFRLSDSEDEL